VIAVCFTSIFTLSTWIFHQISTYKGDPTRFFFPPPVQTFHLYRIFLPHGKSLQKDKETFYTLFCSFRKKRYIINPCFQYDMHTLTLPEQEGFFPYYCLHVFILNYKNMILLRFHSYGSNPERNKVRNIAPSIEQKQS